ncbi:MAG TPA: hypothetical protein VGW38_02740 [Chloroflexota bacterium]|nr:hypothetical protein [Chloroflexota bacterium]
MQHEARLKPATINRRLVTLNRYFAWALGRGLISCDPANDGAQLWGSLRGERDNYREENAHN